MEQCLYQSVPISWTKKTVLLLVFCYFTQQKRNNTKIVSYYIIKGQGHFNMQTGGIEPATFQLQDADSTPEISHGKLLLILNGISYMNFRSKVHPKKQRCSRQQSSSSSNLKAALVCKAKTATFTFPHTSYTYRVSLVYKYCFSCNKLHSV